MVTPAVAETARWRLGLVGTSSLPLQGLSARYLNMFYDFPKVISKTADARGWGNYGPAASRCRWTSVGEIEPSLS